VEHLLGSLVADAEVGADVADAKDATPPRSEQVLEPSRISSGPIQAMSGSADDPSYLVDMSTQASQIGIQRETGSPPGTEAPHQAG
jgi:hypothetical protein